MNPVPTHLLVTSLVFAGKRELAAWILPHLPRGEDCCYRPWYPACLPCLLSSAYLDPVAWVVVMTRLLAAALPLVLESEAAELGGTVKSPGL